MVLAQSLLSLAETLRKTEFARSSFAKDLIVSVSFKKEGFAGKFNLGDEFYTCPPELTKDQNQVLGNWNARVMSSYKGPYKLTDMKPFKYPDGEPGSILSSCLYRDNDGVTYLAAITSAREQTVLIISFIGKTPGFDDKALRRVIAKAIYQKVIS